MELDEHGLSAQGASLLLIIGEPFSEDHKTQILAEITKGFRCWDAADTGININEELAQIADRASLGEEGLNGERIIQHKSENLTVEILLNPLSQSVKTSLKKLLIVPSPVKYIIYAGHAFQDSGAWVLQDDVFAFSNLAQVFKNAEVESALKQNIEASLTIHTVEESSWGTSISKADFTNNLRIQLNPKEKLDTIHGVLQFTAYVGSFVKVQPITNLLQASEQFGNISFSRPTLYIFPGCQGDSALFGVSGFNLLVNGGYNRRACFWDFARHLDRVDAMLLSHLGTDNIFGINSVLQRKNMENIHPQIGYLYFNAPEKMIQGAPNESGDASSENNPSLLVNLAEEGTKLTKLAKQLGISPHPCSRAPNAQTSEPINLYHKLGHGSLDMYVLNPVSDGKELKEYYQQWTKQNHTLGSSGPFPLQYAMSVCTLLVWKPYNVDEKIVRILFPGNAPQHKIAEGLETMKELKFLKLASCTVKDLVKPAPVKKASGRPSSGTASKSTASSSRTERLNRTIRTETARKLESKPSTRPTPAATSTAKPSRPVREETKKPSLKTKEEKNKDAKPSRSSVMSPTKLTASKKSPSPSKASSPTKSPSSPKAASPSKMSSPTKSRSPAKSPSKTPSPEKVISHTKSTSPEPAKTAAIDTCISEGIPAAVPEPSLNNVEHGNLRSESDEFESIIHSEEQSAPVINMEVPPPKEAWTDQPADREPSSPATCSDSTKESLAFNKSKEPSEGLNQQTSNGFMDFSPSNAEHFESEEEEIKPQALPDPPSVVLESPSLESECSLKDNFDLGKAEEIDEKPIEEIHEKPIEGINEKPIEGINERPIEEIHEKPIEEIDEKPIEEIDEKPIEETQEFNDSAQKIPPRPEILVEDTEFSYPQRDCPSNFVFTNDELDTEVHSSERPMEQNILYGIDNSKSRAMGGIQEVDEEEQEDESDIYHADNKTTEEAAFRQMGTYNEANNSGDSMNAFERDDSGNEEMHRGAIIDNADNNVDQMEKQDHQEKDEEEEVKSDCRLSAERQFEDVEDDGLHSRQREDSCIQAEENQPLPENVGHNIHDNDDRDSLDEAVPNDSDKDVDESQSHYMNGAASRNIAEGEEYGYDQVASQNSFIGLDDQNQRGKSYQQSHPFEVDSEDELQAQNNPGFDSVTQWGQPMGLPSPPPLGDSRRGATSPTKSKTGDKRPASASTKSGASGSDAARRKPGAAPSKTSSSSSRTGTTKRLASSLSSPVNSKIPPLPPMVPFYVDLTYIPNHGDPAYCNIEFFKRVRARYYVLSSLSPNPKVLDCLMEAKETWEDKTLEVTLIPTYDNETLRHWMGLNKEKLQELHIDMTPAVSRCTIQLQDLETSLPAYRLEV